MGMKRLSENERLHPTQATHRHDSWAPKLKVEERHVHRDTAPGAGPSCSPTAYFVELSGSNAVTFDDVVRRIVREELDRRGENADG
jgi:hypothetical protein